MIEFVSLFLGLVAGPQTVEVSAAPGVAAVELRLDGRSLGVLRGPPWSLACDLGSELAPHLLTAVASDGAGREVGRVEQRLNVLRARAEARLAFAPDPGGGPPAARLVWHALDYDRPRAVAVTLDGRPLPAADPARIPLPPYDPGAIHLLRAELVFSDAVHTDAELVFGGAFRDDVASELTAVVVRAPDRRLPTVDQMEGWFRAGGRPLRAVAVERTPVDLLVVRQRTVSTLAGLGQMAATVDRARGLDPSFLGRLEPGDRVRYVFPIVERRSRPGHQQELMPISADLAARPRNSLLRILTHSFFTDLDVPTPRERLADAVAIAGMLAAGASRRRAVLLVANGDGEEVSRFSPAEVRRYLDRLQVPFFRWAVPHRKQAPPPGPWDPTRTLLSTAALHTAFADLERALDEQAIVWLEGSHLPGEVELAPGAGVSLLP
jgi:hypothetical protein